MIPKERIWNIRKLSNAQLGRSWWHWQYTVFRRASIWCKWHSLSFKEAAVVNVAIKYCVLDKLFYLLVYEISYIALFFGVYRLQNLWSFLPNYTQFIGDISFQLSPYLKYARTSWDVLRRPRMSQNVPWGPVYPHSVGQAGTIQGVLRRPKTIEDEWGWIRTGTPERKIIYYWCFIHCNMLEIL